MHITSVGLRAWGTQGLRSRERRQVCCVRACVRSGGSASAGEPSALSHPTAVSNASAMCVCVCARAPPSPWVYVRRAGDRMGGVVCACVRVAIVTDARLDARVRPNPCGEASPRLQQHAVCVCVWLWRVQVIRVREALHACARLAQRRACNERARSSPRRPSRCYSQADQAARP